MMLILSAGNAFGQISNSEIAKILSQSKEYNSHVPDLNWIYPGQVLTFEFLDGNIHQIEVEKGDVAWKLVEKLDKLVAIHGPVVVKPDSVVQPQQVVEDKEPILPVQDQVLTKILDWIWQNLFWILLLLLVVGLVGLAFTNEKFKDLLNRDLSSFFKRSKGKFSQSPTTEGKPFVNGGVNAENARNHFVTLAQRNNPGADIQITNRRQGYLSTIGGAPATVEFGDGTKQKLSFRNEPAFAAMVSINGKPAKEEYFFQGCGNPVYTRRSMNAGKNLIFTIEPINFGDEVVNSDRGNIIRETAEVVKEEKPVVEKRVDQSNEVMIINDHAIVAAEFLQTQTAHKVVMEYIKDINGGVTIRSIFETKNPAKEEVKKEKEN